MQNERKINLVSKPLCEFVAGDTIYVKKNEGGYSHIYFCQFISLNRGNVVAKAIGVEDRMLSTLEVGNILTARPTSCFLWGHTDGESVAGIRHCRCHWFKNTKESAK